MAITKCHSSLKQYFFIGFILLFLSFASYAQNATVRGIVTHEEIPLAYATVVLHDTQYGTTTDEHGYFELQQVEPGTYHFHISFLGMETVIREVDISHNVDVPLSFQLQEKSGLLEEVVVTGTMKPTYVSKSPIKVDVITARQLETFLPAASSSIIENVQLINGVQEVISCGVCYTNNISINGLEGAYTAVLMDGTPMYGNLASVYGLNGIPNMIIDRFEVIKGAQQYTLRIRGRCRSNQYYYKKSGGAATSFRGPYGYISW